MRKRMASESKRMVADKSVGYGNKDRLAYLTADRKNPFIEVLPILKNGFFKYGFQNKAGFYQCFLGCQVGAERPCKDPVDVEMFKAVAYHLPDGFCHDALAPERFCEPVSQFRILPENV